MSARTPRGPVDWPGIILKTYVGLFLIYMFIPIFIMAAAAFNANPTPSVLDWRGFTLDWFTGRVDPEGRILVRGLPQEARFLQGLKHSILIALGVIGLSIPLGLAGALLLTRVGAKASTPLYTMLVSPLLTPGIVLGVSTMIFWRDVFGLQAGILTAILAQTCFIASFCMLMFMARLQRQDKSLEEAALDLGASNWFVFRRVTLPYLAPTIVAASAIAFLQSNENYNTTFFAIGSSWTLVTEIGSRMRFGVSPTINAIGVIFMVLTVIFAALWAFSLKRRTT